MTNPNPLATASVPPTGGVRLSMLTLNPRQVQPELLKTNIATSSLLRWRAMARQDPKGEKEPKHTEKEISVIADTASEDSADPGSITSNKSTLSPVFGESNAALGLGGKDSLKRRKPKNNIVKSNSSFVSRVITHDNLSKRLAERDPGGSFAFFNINRAFQWLDLSSASKADPLTKILFTKAHMLCHDVNQTTKHSSHLDVVMGSSASDIIWYEPVSQKYARINKNGIINNSAISKIKWIPGSENLFLAAHMDGSLIVYDKEKEDAPFTSEELVDEAISIEDDENYTLIITKSVNSANQKTNPVASWRLSNQPIHDLAFGPDNRYLAVVSEDGYLRIIDYLQERLTDLYQSFYGGFTCVCWSPDGKYVLTGGQDDLVTIWSLAERQIIARCHGHDSWVTAVAFDPWRCDDKTYRFGSVGDDCKLLLWDFSVGMLHRPKGVRHDFQSSTHDNARANQCCEQTTTRTRGSISAQSVSLYKLRTESASVVNRVRSDSTQGQSNQPTELGKDAEFLNHPVEPRSRTALLPPVMSKKLDEHPLSGLAFEQDCIVTTCSDGKLGTCMSPVQLRRSTNWKTL